MNRRRGIALAFAASFLFSWTGPLITLIVERTGMSSMAIAFWRAALISPTLLLALAVVDRSLLRIRRGEWWLFLGAGLWGVALAHSLWAQSVTMNGVALGTVLFYTSPAFVALGARVLFGERAGSSIWIGVGAVIVGVALASRAHDLASLRLGLGGVLVGIAAAPAYAGYNLAARAAAQRGYQPWATMAIAFAVGAIALVPLALTSGRAAVGSDPVTWGLLLFLSLGPTLGAFGLLTLSLRDLPASIASLIVPTEIVFALLFGRFMFGESMDALQLMGAGLVLVGAALASRAGQANEETA